MSPTTAQVASVVSLCELYEQRGHERYGEDVTQLQHALQCASIAQAAGAGEALVAAALLHDVGHLVADAPDLGRNGLTDDDRHEAVGARLLASLLGPAVAAPVALHVLAKRWRCAVEPAYRDSLSPASIASLVAQGGPLDPVQRARFEAHPAHREAVELRGWDDRAKDPSALVGTFDDYEPLLARLAGAHAGH